jgi:hypothetical protein
VNKSKTKNKIENQAQEDNSLPVIVPELHYLSAKYVVMIPADDKHLKDRWELRKYVEKLIEKKLGDEVQLTSVKVKKPHLLAKSKAKLLKREPYTRILATVKF